MSVWEFGYKDRDGFHRNKYGSISIIKNWVLQYGPKDIYTSVFKYESDNVASSKLEAGLYFDIDSEDYLEAAYEDLLALIVILQSQGIERKLFHVWFSGFKGFHLTIPWNSMRIEPAKDLPPVYKRIALELNQLLPNKNIDLTVYEERRLWRFPNTINSKSGLYKIQLAEDIPTIEEIKGLAKTPQPIKLAALTANKILALWVSRSRREAEETAKPKTIQKFYADKKINSYGQSLLNQGEGVGKRNSGCFYRASYFKSKGFSEDETKIMLLEWGERCNPPVSANTSDFNPKAIEQTVKSAYRLGRNIRR